MKLVTYSVGAAWLPGLVHDDHVANLSEVLAAAGIHHGSPLRSIRAFLEEYGDKLTELAPLLSAALERGAVRLVGSLAEVPLGAPVQDPQKVLCVGLNYADHVGETGRAMPSHPDIFSKFASSLIGPNDHISRSDVTENLDFEGEVAVVIGRTCGRVDEGQALSHVAGLSVLNDITARDLQHRGTQWLPGKALDAATPFGPAVVTLDEVGDPQSLDVHTYVNGVQAQGSNTRHMIFPIARIVSDISQFLTLQPGDVIATGTPEGIGAKRTPPQWLRAGDVVEVVVERVGVQRNEIR